MPLNRRKSLTFRESNLSIPCTCILATRRASWTWMPRNLRYNNDSAPLMMCCSAVGGKREFDFDQGCAFIGLCNRESEPVPISRPGADVPEFSQDLRCVEKLRSVRPKTIRTFPDDPIFMAASAVVHTTPGQSRAPLLPRQAVSPSPG